MLARTFSDGVMGNKIKITRIIPVSIINPIHEAIVTFVDLFRFDINPDFLLILSPFQTEFSYFLIIYHLDVSVKWKKVIIN
jgi:hypothetical protein